MHLIGSEAEVGEEEVQVLAQVSVVLRCLLLQERQQTKDHVVTQCKRVVPGLVDWWEGVVVGWLCGGGCCGESKQKIILKLKKVEKNI